MSAAEMDLRQFCSEQQLKPMVLRGEYFSSQARDVKMAEVSLIPDSALLGHSLRKVAFRSRYGLNVIRRNGEALPRMLIDESLQLGDILLVIGDGKRIRQLQSRTRDFILLNLPAEVDQVAPAASQAAPIALGATHQMGVSPYPFTLLVMAASVLAVPLLSPF